jgi:hypothetical protein
MPSVAWLLAAERVERERVATAGAREAATGDEEKAESSWAVGLSRLGEGVGEQGREERCGEREAAWFWLEVKAP